MKRNLVTSLLLYESVRTTKKRAQVVTPEIDSLINYAKNNSPHIAIRHINKVVTDKNASKKIMEVYTKRFANRKSGLTRVKPAGVRIGDGAHLVDITFVDGEKVEEAPAVEAKEEKKAPAKKPAAKKEEKAPAKKPAAKKAPAKKESPKKSDK